MGNRPRLLAFLVPALLAVPHAMADLDRQVVWKLVDRDGKVTYAGKAPERGFDGTVTRIEIDLTANRATLSTVGGTAPPVLLPLTAPELKRVKADAELARAEARLEAAKKAREAGNEPTQEETQWIGKAGGGARPVPTDSYHERIRKLDDAVKAAEAEYESARRAARQAAID